MKKKKPISPPLSPIREQRLHDNFRKTIIQFMEGKRYEPIGKAALMKRLDIPKSLQETCKKVLDELIQDGIIELSKNQLQIKSSSTEGIRGILRTHPRG